MAKYCPRACSRLAAASAFLAIGVVQVIAGMILLRSEYVPLLSVPNFWTASANIAVGSLLGVSATVWKAVHKSKHAAKRNLLAALAFSSLLLNATTLGILIMGESNNLLSIRLEKTTLAREILAYAYAVSVCSPIACIVISIAFLTDLYCPKKPTKKKSLDFKHISHADEKQIYSWVYTPTLPKHDSEILRKSISESEYSSSDGSSSCSSSTSTYLRYNTSLVDTTLLKRERSNHSSLQNNTNSKVTSVLGSRSKNERVSFADTHNRKQAILNYSESSTNTLRNSKNYQRIIPPIPSENKSGLNKKSRSHGMPKNLFMEYPSGNAIQEFTSPFTKSDISSGHGSLSVKSSGTVRIDSVTPIHNRRIRNLRKAQISDDESPSRYEDSVPHSNAQEISEEFTPIYHEQLRRTSTTEPSKEIEEIKILDNSAISFGSGLNLSHTNETSLNSRSLNTTTSNTTTKNLNKSSAVTTENAIHEEQSKSTSKITPVLPPVVSPERLLVACRKKIPTDKTKSRSKSTRIYHNYVDYNKRGLSSFKSKTKPNEMYGMCPKRHNTVTTSSKSPMKSISESPVNETDISQPSTSTHTSGYMSAFEDESDCSDSEVSANLNKLDLATGNSITEEKIQHHNKNISSSSLKKILKSEHSVSLQRSFQSVLEQLKKENPTMKSDEIRQILKASVV